MVKLWSNPWEQGQSSGTVREVPLIKRILIILVGITGNAKSTTANMLTAPMNVLNNDEDNLPFRTGKNSSACTKVPQEGKVDVDGKSYIVLDTPGYGENPQADFKHTVDLLGHLAKVGQVGAIVYCQRTVADGGKYEQAARDLMDYLRTIFGREQLESNLITLVTGQVGHEPGSPGERQELMEIQQRVKEHLGLNGITPVLALNGNPVPPLDHRFKYMSREGKEACFQHSMQQRLDFFKAIDEMPMLDVSSLSVPKPDWMLAEDAETSRQLRADLETKQATLQAYTQEEEALLVQQKVAREKLARIGAQKMELTQDLGLLDCDTELPINKTPYSMTRGRFSFKENPKVSTFTAEVRISMAKVVLTDSGDSSVVEYSRDRKAATVKLYAENEYVGRIEAEVTLMTTSRDKYADRIRQIKDQLRFCDHMQVQEETVRDALQERARAIKMRCAEAAEEFTTESERVATTCAQLELPRLTVEAAAAHFQDRMARAPFHSA
eukprot:TRINITY_DN17504_c0_g1_i1.p1 TRINITY_DN17504_c0_g1~~TRINITY_DN17504_c0_g1_i1.p1  ORF type:complete len:496 (+),score=140.08 TRINITY_DN17504_c0_g1_i1:275-1762(+)